MSRPSFKPTREQRTMVQSLAAIGMRHEQIALVVGVRSPKTVRKHFRKELTLGSAEALAAVTRTAFEMASSGKHPRMTEYWLAVMSDAAGLADSIEGDDQTSSPVGTCELIFVSPPPPAHAEQEVPRASDEV